MRWTDPSWKLRRALIDRLGLLQPFSGGGSQRLLFITVDDPISLAQVFPFHHHRADFAREHQLEIRELPLKRFQLGNHPYGKGRVDAVAFQTWFDLEPAEMEQLVEKIRRTWPEARLAYFDWFAPTDLRYASVLNDHLQAYVKKQVLCRRELYGQPTLGDTNLTDHYARRFGISYPETTYHVPDSFWDKLHLGTHFAFSDYMLPHFMGALPTQATRSIDVHARMAVKGTEWYARMRGEALAAVQGLESRFRVVSRGSVPRKEFLRELGNSKLCFSPFGYGELCWRDFEAMMVGSVLVKPDVSHLQCYPQIFSPQETYVAVAWDLSDFEEKVERQLAREAERRDIASNAFERLRSYLTEGRFVQETRPLLRQLGLAG